MNKPFYHEKFNYGVKLTNNGLVVWDMLQGQINDVFKGHDMREPKTKWQQYTLVAVLECGIKVVLHYDINFKYLYCEFNVDRN